MPEIILCAGCGATIEIEPTDTNYSGLCDACQVTIAAKPSEAMEPINERTINKEDN